MGGMQDQERRDNLLRALTLGMSLLKAIKFSGLPRGTVYQWRARGRQEEEDDPDAPEHTWSRYRAFWHAIEQATSQGQAGHLANIQRAAQHGDWRASAWWLERTDPEHFAKTTRHELSGKTEQVIVVDLSKESTDAVRDLAGKDYPELSRVPHEIITVDDEDDEDEA